MKMPIYPGRERSVTNCSQKSGLSLGPGKIKQPLTNQFEYETDLPTQRK
jgi:hypothetical protein